MDNLLSALLETKSAHLADVLCDAGAPESLLVRSDLTGTMQLYELLPPGGLRQITSLPEPVGTARYVPGTRRVVIELDRGGNEKHQLYLVDLDADSGPVGTEGLRALTSDPRYGNHIAGLSPDGNSLAYLSNRANGVDFDLWLCDLVAEEHNRLYATGSWCQPASGFSPDGSLISIMRPGPRPLDVDLLLVDTQTGDVRTVLEHADEAAVVGAPAWIDATTFFVSTNVGTDHATVVRHDLADGSSTALAGTDAQSDAQSDAQWDAHPITSADGSTLIVVENRDGSHQMTSQPVAQGAAVVVPIAEAGVVLSHLIAPPLVSADGSCVYYTLSTPRIAGDVWSWNRHTGETRRLTSSPAPVASDRLVEAELSRTESFDGEAIPMFTYRHGAGDHRHGAGDHRHGAGDHRHGAGDQPAPVVVFIHGGPESQSVLSFNPVIQGLVAAGFAVVVPNVRGSTGYGKRYAALDDTTLRLDSVRDLAAVHKWLSEAGLDADRAALWGGSYGGYMVLAGLAFQPGLWAAGVDIVGISDLVTFLENTSDYRRKHREREYGSLEHDREFLATASPLRSADAIRAPLFVIHGLNDPRVPVSEAEQLTASLRGRKVRCELLIYDDEGHGLARLKNRLDAYPRALEFLAEVMAPAPDPLRGV
jgi:dipeptidyl aminopeptidase/acylaminoacyl peptidase